MWRLECGEKPPAADTGFVFGTVRSAGNPKGVNVQASWIDLAGSGTKISQKLRTLAVGADSLGNFALCGIPASTGFSIQATAADSSLSGAFDVAPLDRERVIRRDLRLIAPDAKGTASISGVVLSDSGRGPLADAQVSLTNAGLVTKANERGEYSFGELSPGSYRVYVRKIGYAEAELGVDVEAGDHRQQNVVMNRITLLDSVVTHAKVFARDEQMRVFEEHRKMGLAMFLDAAQLEKSRGFKLTSLVRQWRGVYIPNRPTAAERDPVSKRGITTISGSGCKIALYLDGIRLAIPFEDVPPETLAGLEYYASPATTPIEYVRPGSGQCGVILMHSRYKTGK